jgi:hypothetical protein
LKIEQRWEHVSRTIWIVVILISVLLLALVVALAVGGAIAIVSNSRDGAEESVPQPEVVVLLCSGNLEVVASDRSANVPTVTATSCAQALSDLLQADFTIQDVQPVLSGDGTQYTLIK